MKIDRIDSTNRITTRWLDWVESYVCSSVLSIWSDPKQPDRICDQIGDSSTRTRSLIFFFFQVIVETTLFQFETILILEITISFLSRSRSTPPLRSPTSPSFLLLIISLSVSHSLTFYTVARQRPTYLSFLPLVMELCYCHLLCCHLQSRS